MKQFLILFASLIFALQPAFAQSAPAAGSKPDRKEWMAKMRKVKHEFLAKELQLTEEQKKDFFDAYDKCEQARHNLEYEARQREKAVEKKADAATDAELDAVIADQFSLEERLGAIDRSYLAKYQKVLTRRQLARLKHAERKFNRKLMEQRANPPAKKSKK